MDIVILTVRHMKACLLLYGQPYGRLQKKQNYIGVSQNLLPNDLFQENQGIVLAVSSGSDYPHGQGVKMKLFIGWY
jgi:hypothetical protein